MADATAAGSTSCRAPVRIADFGSDGRIGAKGNAATATIVFRLARPLSFISDTAFFGDVLTQSLGPVGRMVHVDCQ